jgi:hypothetical protein
MREVGSSIHRTGHIEKSRFVRNMTGYLDQLLRVDIACRRNI